MSSFRKGFKVRKESKRDLVRLITRVGKILGKGSSYRINYVRPR